MNNIDTARNLIILAIADLSECIGETHFDEAESEVETLHVVREKLQTAKSLLATSEDMHIRIVELEQSVGSLRRAAHGLMDRVTILEQK